MVSPNRDVEMRVQTGQQQRQEKGKEGGPAQRLQKQEKSDQGPDVKSQMEKIVDPEMGIKQPVRDEKEDMRKRLEPGMSKQSIVGEGQEGILALAQVVEKIESAPVIAPWREAQHIVIERQRKHCNEETKDRPGPGRVL